MGGEWSIEKGRVGNSQGIRPWPVFLNEPGPPDMPQHCSALNVTDHEAKVSCVPGYLGGEPLDFHVEKQSPHDNRETVSVREAISKGY